MTSRVKLFDKRIDVKNNITDLCDMAFVKTGLHATICWPDKLARHYRSMNIIDLTCVCNCTVRFAGFYSTRLVGPTVSEAESYVCFDIQFYEF